MAFFKEADRRRLARQHALEGRTWTSARSRASYGGGGHKNAAGCTVRGELAALQETLPSLMARPWRRSPTSRSCGRRAGRPQAGRPARMTCGRSSPTHRSAVSRSATPARSIRNASGVLPLVLGRATRLAQHLTYSETSPGCPRGRPGSSTRSRASSGRTPTPTGCARPPRPGAPPRSRSPTSRRTARRRSARSPRSAPPRSRSPSRSPPVWPTAAAPSVTSAPSWPGPATRTPTTSTRQRAAILDLVHDLLRDAVIIQRHRHRPRHRHRRRDRRRRHRPQRRPHRRRGSPSAPDHLHAADPGLDLRCAAPLRRHRPPRRTPRARGLPPGSHHGRFGVRRGATRPPGTTARPGQEPPPVRSQGT